MTSVPTLITLLLDELSEKEMELPFRSLLRSLGYHTIFERTRHGPGEHGKDIVACSTVDGIPSVHVYQLKTREINVNRFRTEVKPELEAMIEVPINNPLIKGSEPRFYYFVSTGDLSPDASIEFKAFNDRNKGRGEPEVELINKPKLVKMFLDDLASLSIFTSEFQDDLAHLWLDIKINEYDREKWFALVNRITGKKTRKELTFLALCTSFIASQALFISNFFDSCDIFRIALLKIYECTKHMHITEMKNFDRLHEEYIRLVESYIDRNSKNLIKDYGLFKENKGTIESLLYPLRSWNLIGLLSYLAYYRGSIGELDKERELVELIEVIITKNPSFYTPVLDSLRKDIAITLRELVKNGKTKTAKILIQKMLDNLYRRFTLSGWWPSTSQKIGDIIEDTYQFTEREKESPTSFLIPILFRFCAKLGLKTTYDRFRPLFEDFMLCEYIPPVEPEVAESILINGKLDQGTTVDKKYPEDFSEYCLDVSNIQLKTYPLVAKDKKHILHLISDVHAHYVFPEVYLDL